MSIGENETILVNHHARAQALLPVNLRFAVYVAEKVLQQRIVQQRLAAFMGDLGGIDTDHSGFSLCNHIGKGLYLQATRTYCWSSGCGVELAQQFRLYQDDDKRSSQPGGDRGEEETENS